MDDFLKTAVCAAKEAGEIILEGADRLGSLTVEEKSSNDFVSEIDRNAEKKIRKVLLDTYPDHGIVGEEFGSYNTSNTQYDWVIDPLDGTTNFLRGIPHFAVSIGLIVDGEIKLGVVYDPLKNELYTAVKGGGAHLNGKAISVRANGRVEGGLLATGIPFSGRLLEDSEQFSNAMTNLLNEKTAGIRRLGAAALDLAYVAAGRYDGFWEAGLKQWDIAAGIVLVQEAGGRVSDFQGKNEYLTSGNIVACTPAASEKMLSIIGEAYKVSQGR